VSFTPSHRCNIVARIVLQESTRTVEISRQRADDEGDELLPYLVRLIAGGGEPFLLPIWNKFLNNSTEANPYLDSPPRPMHHRVRQDAKVCRVSRSDHHVSLDGTERPMKVVRIAPIS